MRLQHILFITAFFAFSFVNANNNFTIKTVVIDAGHGGKDPGASGPSKTNEKDVALVVALKLGDYIQKNFPDINVIYTRKTDVFLELHERADIANKAKADLFIAVHCNSSPNGEAYGTSSYVLGLHRTEANLDVAKRENSVILMEENRDKNYEFDPNSPEGHIIMSMKQNAFLDQSIDFASKIENQLENYSKRKSLGVKQAGFYVLYKTTMPSLLAEIGFISNPEEEKYLNSVKGQDQIATGLFNAFKDYKGEMEGGSGLSVATSVETETKAETKTEPAKKEEVKTEPVKTEPAKAETKTQTSTAPATTTAKTTTANNADRTEQNSVVIKSGKNIRKPIENSSGGGKGRPANAQAKGADGVQPIYVTASNLDPFDTMSMRTLNKQKATNTKTETTTAETKASSTKVTETKAVETKTTETKTVKEPEVKTESNKSPLVAAHKTEGGTVFKIQLFALKGELKEYDKVSKLFEVLTAEELPNGFTRYYGGHSKTYSEAKKLLAVALDHGYKAAFIIGFKEGNRMSGDEMKALEK